MALGRAVLAATGSALAATGLMLACCINPELNRYHWMLLTESLFVSLTIAILALIVLMVQRPQPRLVVLMSTAIGLAIAVRPPGYAFVPLLPVLGLLLWPRIRERWLVYLAGAVVPLLVVLTLETLAYAWHHPLPRDSLTGRHMFAKAALIDAGIANPYPDGHPYRAIWQQMETDAAPVRRLIAAAPGHSARSHVLRNYEVTLQYRFAEAAVMPASKATGLSPSAVMLDVGLARLRSAPLGYLWLSAQHFGGLWVVYAASHPASAPQINAFLDAHRPLPMDDASGSLTDPAPTRSQALLVQPVMLALGAVTALAILLLAASWLARTPPPALIIAGVSALMVNGNFLLIALTGVGIPRYTLAMWPAIMTTAMFLPLASVEHFAPAKARSLRDW